MGIEAFEAKSGAELAELASQRRASIVGNSRGLHLENGSASQDGAHFACTTRKLSIMLYYMLDLSHYMLDLSNYSGTSNVSSNACIV